MNMRKHIQREAAANARAERDLFPGGLYTSPDGRTWWINERHPDTGQYWVVARAVEGGSKTHTAIWDRDRLTRVTA